MADEATLPWLEAIVYDSPNQAEATIRNSLSGYEMRTVSAVVLGIYIVDGAPPCRDPWRLERHNILGKD